MATGIFLLLGLLVGPFLFPQHPALKVAWVLVSGALLIIVIKQMRRFNA